MLENCLRWAWDYYQHPDSHALANWVATGLALFVAIKTALGFWRFCVGTRDVCGWTGGKLKGCWRTLALARRVSKKDKAEIERLLGRAEAVAAYCETIIQTPDSPQPRPTPQPAQRNVSRN